MKVGTPKSGCVIMLLMAITLAVSSVMAFVTFDLVVEPYPGAGWEAAAFTGTIVAKEGKPNRKPEWAIVQTDDGSRLRMPIDVHNGFPATGERVRKLSGEVHGYVYRAGDPTYEWITTFRPRANPGDRQIAGLGWWGLWCTVMGAVSLVAGVRLHRGGPTG